MATAFPPSISLPPDRPANGRSLGDELISKTIADAQTSLWRAELSRRLLRGVIVGLLGLVFWFVLDQWLWSPGRGGRSLALAGALGVFGWWAVTRILPLLRSRVRAEYAAQSLEADLPEMRHSLTSYVALRDDFGSGGVRAAVLRSIGTRAAGQLQRQRLESPSEATGTFPWWIGLAATLAVVAAYGLFSPKNTLRSAQRLLMPLANIEPPTRVTIVSVEPGDGETLTMRPLEIIASIDGLGARDQPAVRFGSDFRQAEPLLFDESRGDYRATISVARSTSYQIVAGDAVAGPFRIAVRDVPVVSIGSVHIVPPTYTRLPPRTSTGGAISAEENSRVTMAATMNRPMVRARVEFNPRDSGGSATAAAPVTRGATNGASRGAATAGFLDMVIAEDGRSASVGFPLRLPRGPNDPVKIDSYRIRIWDTDGNENPEPIIYRVQIIPDLAPEIRFASPRETVREVPVNGQLLMELAAVDPDYGLRRVDWSLRRGADPAKIQTVWSAENGVTENQFIDLKFQPERMGFRVGDRISVSAIAEDNREDWEGNPEPNRTETDAIELQIVAARELPPPSAPENGLSEPEDESATGDQESGTATDGAATGSDPQDGSGQSDEGQTGESDPADDKSMGEGKAGEGKSENGDDPSDASRTDGQESGDSQKSGDDKPRDGAGADGKPGDGDQPGEDSPAESPAQDTASQGGEPGGEDRPQPDATDETMDDQSGSKSPGDGESAASADPKSGETADPLDQPGERGQAPDDGSPTDGSPSEGVAGEGDSSGEGKADDRVSEQPPQHDGDAFERIRDYLENQRDRSAGQPPQQPPGQPGDEAGSADSPSPQPGSPDAEAAADSSDEARGDSDATKGPSATDQATDQAGESGKPGGASEASETPAESGEAAAGEGADSDSPSPSAPGAAADDPLSQPPARNGQPPAGEGQPADQGQPADGGMPAGGEQDAAAGERSGDERSAGESKPGSGENSGDGAAGSDSGGSGESAAADTRPPDPVDLDYAKQATDLVLDYLNQNRDTPDPELLDRLNWTPEELQEFTQRWNRQLKQPGSDAAAADPRQVEEALKSLGIRPPGEGPIGASREQADDLRGLRDAGGRRPAPNLHRDAFEAFRQGLRRP
ncbi:MAG: hypothetical protein EA381_12345 [Planctomycetaceae bacterium]|nr:MAG: hypothetical protein EA381_12345 [Planctomycetaceae bacterium]